MASSIGIKIANGEFYPVLEEGSTVKKRLVLTTVHDGQQSVQIDLYRSESRSMIDGAYIGSLVVENIADMPKGEPSIELVIGSETSDELSAEAVDLDAPSSGSRQSLNVFLKAVNDGETYDVPDFELEEGEGEALAAPPAGLYEEPESEEEVPRRGRFPVVPVLVAVLAVLLVGAVLAWFFAFGRKDAVAEKVVPRTEQASPIVSVPAPAPAEAARITPAVSMQASPAVQPPAPKTAKAEPAIAAPSKPTPSVKPAAASVSKSEAAARRVRSSAPVKSYKVPKTIPKEGFRYRIRWGDTLWDISEAFYRNPWLYPRIVRFNKIRNADFILAGAFIRIPPKK